MNFQIVFLFLLLCQYYSIGTGQRVLRKRVSQDERFLNFLQTSLSVDRPSSDTTKIVPDYLLQQLEYFRKYGLTKGLTQQAHLELIQNTTERSGYAPLPFNRLSRTVYGLEASLIIPNTTKNDTGKKPALGIAEDYRTEVYVTTIRFSKMVLYDEKVGGAELRIFFVPPVQTIPEKFAMAGLHVFGKCATNETFDWGFGYHSVDLRKGGWISFDVEIPAQFWSQDPAIDQYFRIAILSHYPLAGTTMLVEPADYPELWDKHQPLFIVYTYPDNWSRSRRFHAGFNRALRLQQIKNTHELITSQTQSNSGSLATPPTPPSTETTTTLPTIQPVPAEEIEYENKLYENDTEYKILTDKAWNDDPRVKHFFSNITVDIPGNVSETVSFPCRRHHVYIDFDVPWIIEPESIIWGFCGGTCTEPDQGETNYAKVQAALHQHIHELPPPSCVPTQLEPLTIMYKMEDKKIGIKRIPGILVNKCGCK